MLDDAAFAFLILTAEDKQADGTLHARLNVVHEAGLFQGRLGFKKAIMLFEETCEEFSNIHGLGHIPFPKGKISTAFEEIRRVLEREQISSPSPMSPRSRRFITFLWRQRFAFGFWVDLGENAFPHLDPQRKR